MDVAEAVKRAKSYVADVFADEKISALRLEEVEFDDAEEAWLVTVSAIQPTVPSNSMVAAYLHEPGNERIYKLVRLADDGSGIPSIKVRSFALDAP